MGKLRYLPRDLIKNIDEKLTIENISSHVVCGWNNREAQNQDEKTQEKDATDEEKKLPKRTT